MQMKTILRRALLASAGILLLNPAQAQDFENRGNIYGGFTHYNFDSKWNLGSDEGWMFGAEIPVAERWALSIERSWLDPRSELLPISGDFDWTRIGPNYLLQNIDGWQPYLAAGVGRNKLDIGSGNSEL